jgi:hypothetical protein
MENTRHQSFDMFATKIGLANSLVLSILTGLISHIINGDNGIDIGVIGLGEVIGGALAPIFIGLIVGLIFSAFNTTKKSINIKKSIFYTALVMIFLSVFGYAHPVEELDYSGYNKLILIFFASVVAALIILGNYLFIKKYSQSNRTLLNNTGLQGVEIEDKYWLQASNELNDSRHEATWLRAFSESEGDELKAKAIYLKTRAYHFKINGNDENAKDFEIEASYNQNNTGNSDNVDLVMKKNSKVALIWVFGLIILSTYILIKFVTGNTEDSKSQISQESNVETQVAESGMCYLYWDGWKFVNGMKTDNSFNRYKLSRNGVEVVDVALPTSMVKVLEAENTASGSTMNMRSEDGLIAFLNQRSYEIEILCKP